MRVLALEGYYGGSHKAFLDGWIAKSRHDWSVLTLPANKWKWRMRHGAVSFAGEVTRRAASGERWDVVFCSEMLNVAEFRGLVGGAMGQVPLVVYFHENQLTYPVRFESERDYQYVMTNFTTALGADQVWFNSGFHRDEFLGELTGFFKRMPDNQPLECIEAIRAKSSVHPPGIDGFGNAESGARSGQAHIVWAGRWEHDKNPEDFFAALRIVKEEGVDFRLSVMGERFREVPEVFGWAEEFFSDHIDHWGYLPSRSEYRSVLCDADIVVSTAGHEFFGISIVEAIAAGAYPVLPRRLSYPEIVGNIGASGGEEFFYDGSVKGLVKKLEEEISRVAARREEGSAGRAEAAMVRYEWCRRAEAMDNDLEGVV